MCLFFSRICMITIFTSPNGSLKLKTFLTNTVYLIYGVRNQDWIPNFERRPADRELRRWHEKLYSKLLYEGYKLLKVDFIFEMYLTTLRLAERICMSKFRCGNHNLPVSGMIVILFPNHVPLVWLESEMSIIMCLYVPFFVKTEIS